MLSLFKNISVGLQNQEYNVANISNLNTNFVPQKGVNNKVSNDSSTTEDSNFVTKILDYILPSSVFSQEKLPNKADKEVDKMSVNRIFQAPEKVNQSDRKRLNLNKIRANTVNNPKVQKLIREKRLSLVPVRTLQEAVPEVKQHNVENKAYPKYCDEVNYDAGIKGSSVMGAYVTRVDLENCAPSGMHQYGSGCGLARSYNECKYGEGTNEYHCARKSLKAGGSTFGPFYGEYEIRDDLKDCAPYDGMLYEAKDGSRAQNGRTFCPTDPNCWFLCKRPYFRGC